MSSLSLLLTLAGCALCALLPYRQSSSLSENHKTLAFLLFLSSCFIAAGSLAEWGIESSTTDAETAKRLFSNLKHYIAIPLISSLILATSWHRFWSTAMWGRWVLALFALFELMRRTDLGGHYALALGGAVTVALLVAFIRYKNNDVRLPGMLSALLIGASTTVLDTTSLLPQMQNDLLNALCLSSGLALVGLATGRIIRQPQKNEL